MTHFCIEKEKITADYVDENVQKKEKKINKQLICAVIESIMTLDPFTQLDFYVHNRRKIEDFSRLILVSCHMLA